jgi:hypothetical protein
MVKRILTGCSIALLLAIGFLVTLAWVAQGPGRRADYVREKIHPGMNVLEIESLMPKRTSLFWNFCRYSIRKSGEWKDVSREEFSQAVNATPPDAPQETQVWLAFYGMASRCWIMVHADGSGRVVKVDDPKGGG